jgi:hypothetical protein
VSPSIAIGPFVVGEKPAPLLYTFEDSNGVVIDLTGYTAKYFVKERDSGITPAALAATVPVPLQGQVQYSWVGSEFPTPGHYLSEFWVGNLTQRWCSILIEFDVRWSLGVVPNI